MRQASKAIALSYMKYSETSVIARFYTEAWGVHSFIVKGVRSKKSRFSLAALQPFSLVEIEANVKPMQTLSVLSQLHLKSPLNDIPFNIVKSSIALFIAEIILKTTEANEPNPGLFAFIDGSVHALDETRKPENFHLFFVLHLTKYLGFYPTNKYSPSTPIFNLLEGCFESKFEKSEYQLSEKWSQKWSEILSAKMASFEQLPFSRKERGELLHYLITFLNLHLEGMGTIKSLDVLETVFT